MRPRETLTPATPEVKRVLPAGPHAAETESFGRIAEMLKAALLLELA